LVVFITVQNLVGIDAVVLIICKASFSILRLWLENTYSRPFWGFWGTFSPKNVTHRLNPQKDRPWGNHVIWAIKHEYRPRGSTRACEEEKSTWQDRAGKKITKGLCFTYLGRSPHWSDLHQKLCSKGRPRRNHMCQVSKWNFQGLRFYISYWFLNVPYSSALLRCLWYMTSFLCWPGERGSVY